MRRIRSKRMTMTRLRSRRMGTRRIGSKRMTIARPQSCPTATMTKITKITKRISSIRRTLTRRSRRAAMTNGGISRSRKMI